MSKKLTLAFLMWASIVSYCYSMEVTLQWDTHLQPDVTQYNVYYGYLPGVHEGTGALEGDSPITIALTQDENPDSDVIEFTLNLPDCVSYYYTVTALDDFDRESGKSNEVSTKSGAADYFSFEEE